MPRENPIEKKLTPVERKIARAGKRYYDEYRRRLDAGETPEKAAAAALRRSGFVAVVTDATAEGIVEAIKTGGADTGIAFVREVWLNETYKGSTISKRILRNARLGSAQVSTVTRNAMRDGKAWNAIAADISDAELVAGDISKKISTLADIGKSRLTEAVDEKVYREALADAKDHIARLAKDGAPTLRLKAAYNDVIDAVKNGSEKAIDSAIRQAVNAKMNYNGQRIARTEMARAWGHARANEFLDDDDIVGYRWRLSSRHPKFDVCDLHSGADMYGMGAGVYPKDKGPEYPAHPNCLCSRDPVWRSDVEPDFNPDAGREYLEKQSEFKRRQMLGAKGAEAFADGEDWQKVLVGYTGQKPIVKVPLQN